MPSTPDRSQSALSSPSGRSILSRIASPFGSKPRNIADFFIELEEPHKQHSPGDIVKGHVRLRVSKAIRVTHLVVCLHGFVQVYRNPGSPDSGFRPGKEYLGTGTSRGKKSGEYFGNGFASLFEDEVVLCGDGKLQESSYQFNFELEFPDRDLPSSIDFERGTITYMITATLTRPTTITPTIFCDRKVYFVERIDISPLYPPKPRTITLAPIPRRHRAKDQARKLVDSSDKKSRKTDSAEHGSDPPRHSEASSGLSGVPETSSPDSPDPSELSFRSRLSSQDQTSQSEYQQRGSPTTSEEGRINASKSSLANKLITATIESQAGGCLRGDSIPIKVFINHTKPVKSVYGVIATLYRQARVDMHPSIPLGPTEKGKGSKFEDYYPRSVTGLGGLSLTGAGSSHIFRKDLSQVMAPLYINPQTLTADINTKVRVPDEAFPTISTVPGAMISFKYYVEVILDIQGRLSNSDRSLTNLSGHGTLPGHAIDLEGSDMERSAFTPFGSIVIDTSSIRRDKSVVTSTFEVIVGTRDSERRRGKRKLMETITEPEQQAQPEQRDQHNAQGGDANGSWYDPNAYYDYSWYDHQQYWDWYYGYRANHVQQDAGAQDPSYAQPPPVPVPQMPDESQMTEKQRMQQAEQRLLPSQPPGMENGDGEMQAGASAPYLPGESDALGSAPNYEAATSNTSTPVPGPSTSVLDHPRQMPMVPEYEPPEAGSSAMPVYRGDDKQEMQRQELQNSASAPPAEDEDAEASMPNEATAPTLPDVGERQHNNNEHDSHADAVGSTDLPQYER